MQGIWSIASGPEGKDGFHSISFDRTIPDRFLPYHASTLQVAEFHRKEQKWPLDNGNNRYHEEERAVSGLGRSGKGHGRDPCIARIRVSHPQQGMASFQAQATHTTGQVLCN